ncbi:MAG: TRAP transporter small permease [Burkholderiales bacterium]|nr:TRAP transporter small permease [Burkholderiales bacterium]
MRRTLNAMFDAAGALAAFFVFVIFAVMIGTSMFRLVGWRTGGFEDIVSWLTAAAAFFGMAHTFKHGDFVRVGLLLENLAPPWRRAFEIAGLCVGSLFTGYLAWSVSAYVYDSFQVNDMSNGLVVIPLWIPQLSIVIGSTLFFLAMVDELVQVVGGARPSYVTAVEERHAKGDFTEDV